MNPLLTAALGYAQRGWPVLPLHSVRAGGACSCGNVECGSIGKHPRTSKGLKDATTDPEVIRRWWAQWPDANIGVVTGPSSGIWMLGPDGVEGLLDLDRLVEDLGGIPTTYRVASGSGGEHWYFKWPADGKPIPNRKNHRGLKIDVRGCGDGPGYIVAPPSVNGNGPYKVIDQRELVEAPARLLEWVRGTSSKATPPKPRPGVIERAKLYLAKCNLRLSSSLPGIQRRRAELYAGMRLSASRRLCPARPWPPQATSR